MIYSNKDFVKGSTSLWDVVSKHKKVTGDDFSIVSLYKNSFIVEGDQWSFFHFGSNKANTVKDQWSFLHFFGSNKAKIVEKDQGSGFHFGSNKANTVKDQWSFLHFFGSNKANTVENQGSFLHFFGSNKANTVENQESFLHFFGSNKAKTVKRDQGPGLFPYLFVNIADRVDGVQRNGFYNYSSQSSKQKGLINYSKLLGFSMGKNLAYKLDKANDKFSKVVNSGDFSSSDLELLSQETYSLSKRLFGTYTINDLVLHKLKKYVSK